MAAMTTQKQIENSDTQQEVLGTGPSVFPLHTKRFDSAEVAGKQHRHVVASVMEPALCAASFLVAGGACCWIVLRADAETAMMTRTAVAPRCFELLCTIKIQAYKQPSIPEYNVVVI